MKRLIKYVLLLIILLPIGIYADNEVTIESVKELEKGWFTEVLSEPEINGTNIDINVKFYEPNTDYIKYRVTYKNDTDDDYKINTKDIFKESNYLKYEYTYEDNNEYIKAHSTEYVDIKITYVNQISDITYKEDNLLGIEFSHNKIIEILDNPKTGITNPLIYLLLVIVGISLYLLIKNKYRFKNIHIFLLLLILIIPMYVYALSILDNINTHVEIENLQVAYLIKGNTYDKNATGDDRGFNSEAKKLVTKVNMELSDITKVNVYTKNDKVTDEIVSLTTSPVPVYMEFNSDTKELNLYTKAYKIYLNENSGYMFYNFTGCTSVDISKFDSSLVKKTTAMFQNFGRNNNADMQANMDFTYWNLENLENGIAMFEICNIHDINLSNKNLKSLQTVNAMFASAKIHDLDMSNTIINNDNKADLTCVFSSTFVHDFNLSNSNLSGVSTMNDFAYGAKFNDIYLDNITINNKYNTDLGYLFCKTTFNNMSFTNCNFSSSVNSQGLLEESKSNNINFVNNNINGNFYYFFGCLSSGNINVKDNNFDVASRDGYDMYYLFYKVNANELNVENLNINAENTEESAAFIFAFENVKNLKINNMNFNQNVKWNCLSMFGNSQFDTVELKNSKLGQNSNFENMFIDAQASKIDIKDVSFSGSVKLAFCTSKFDELNMTNCDLTGTTSTSYMFYNSKIKSVNLTNVNLSSNTNATYMFNSATTENINTNDCNFGSITDMTNMFSRMSNIKELDLTGFDTSHVTTMESMFKDSKNLKTIYVSNKFKINSVTNSKDMFNGCTSLVGGKGTTYDLNHIDVTYAHIDGGSTNPGYLSTK